MKKYIFIILSCIASNNAVAQHSNLDKIKIYYHSIDKGFLIDSLYQQHIRKYNESNALLAGWGLYVDSVTNNKWVAKLHQNLAKIRNDSSVVLIVPKFKNVANYSFDKDIYDFIAVDTIETEIRCVNIQASEVTILNHNQFLCIKYSEKDLKKLIKLKEVIEREKPEVLFLESWIFSDAKKDNTNYLFLKGDKIYVYRSKHMDMYELNDFVRKFFKLDKDFKERMILNEQGLVRIGTP